MRTQLGNNIFGIISRHYGSARAISPREIALELGEPETYERAVRRVIAAERDQWPAIVCAKLAGRGDEGGYFVAETYQEIEAYWAWLSDLESKAIAKREGFEALCQTNGINLQQRKAA
jgi:hypothetical protein